MEATVQEYGPGKRETADILREHGINPTTQRTEIAHYMLQKPQHLSAEDVLNGLNGEYERVSQATVYNTLRLLVDKGILRELVFSPDRIYYDSNTQPHHHFIDTQTGSIYDLPVASIQLSDLKLNGMQAHVSEVNLLIKGKLPVSQGN
jgi:Fur family iron response transcriptional regulator